MASGCFDSGFSGTEEGEEETFCVPFGRVRQPERESMVAAGGAKHRPQTFQTAIPPSSGQILYSIPLFIKNIKGRGGAEAGQRLNKL